MLLLVVYLYVGVVVIFCLYVGLGWRAASARRYLLKGARLAQEQKFPAAREALLIAARQSPMLKANPDVQALYELVVNQSTGDATYEIKRIVPVLQQIPKPKWEKFVEHPGFKAALILLAVLPFLIKLLGK